MNNTLEAAFQRLSRAAKTRPADMLHVAPKPRHCCRVCGTLKWWRLGENWVCGGCHRRAG